MKIMQTRWFPWVAVGLLAFVCTVLAWHQYFWLGQISQAQLRQLREQLDDRLTSLSTAFEQRIGGAIPALEPSPDEVRELGVEPAVAARFSRWQETNDPVFSKIGLASVDGNEVRLRLLDFKTATFVPADWPQEWRQEELQILNRFRSGFNPGQFGRGGRGQSSQPDLIEIPIFRRGPPGREFEGDRALMLLQVNTEFARSRLIPELMAGFRHGTGEDYDAAVIDVQGLTLYETVPGIGLLLIAAHDAKLPLVMSAYRGGMPGRGFGRRGGPRAEGPRDPPEGFPNTLSNNHNWTVYAAHKAGSLEKLVDQVRFRNLEISGLMMLLIVAITAFLVLVSREAGRLAALQMSFVTGVSHELRTPLTVIRTAAFNLRGKLSRSPEQVERYGQLIQEESETLTALVEQVLLFSRTKSGQSLRVRKSVSVDSLLEAAIRASLAQQAGAKVEKRIEDGVTAVFVDEAAMTQAIRNLIDNAVKYGGTDPGGITITASRNSSSVELLIADQGPGIPGSEIPHIFEAFYRGRKAVDEQIHGTGLGLSLTKSIVESHGGSIRVHCPPGGGTRFTITIPVAS